MKLNFNDIIHVLGMIFVLTGACMIPALVVSMVYCEKLAFISFLITILGSVLLGLFITYFFKPTPYRLRIREGFVIVAFCWIIASAVGAIPFVICGEIPSFIDAFFETCSGFSTTGSSILTDVEALSKSMLFWRSFTHWLGGMGILIFTIALMPVFGMSGNVIARAEVTGPTMDKLSPKMSDTAKGLYLIYICLTAIQTVLLLLGGMDLYDSLVYTFGSVGTGGFSTYNASVAHYDSPYIDGVITVFMILAGVNFHIYFSTFKHGLQEVINDSELRLYALILAGSTLLIVLNLYFSQVYDSLGTAFRYSAFQVGSIMTTTGYVTADYDLWPTFSKMILFLLMLVGGCCSSTGGGIKVIRILVVLKMIKRGISVRLHPNAIVNIRIGDRTLPSDTVSAISGFVFLYIATLFVSSILVSLDNFDMITSISAVVACLGNIGPGFALVGPTLNFSLFSDPVTLLLSFLMLAGRLELFTIFLLGFPRFWNANR